MGIWQSEYQFIYKLFGWIFSCPERKKKRETIYLPTEKFELRYDGETRFHICIANGAPHGHPQSAPRHPYII